MSNRKKSADANEQQLTNSPGSMIRSARQEAGMTEQELADHLRLRLAVVKGIEQDQYEGLASSTFLRGYLRAIARVLELDAEQLLRAYENIRGDTDVESNVKMQSFSQQHIRERNDNRLKWASYIIIAIVLGAAIIWWIQESDFRINTITGSDDAPTQAEFIANQDESKIAVSVRPRSQSQPAFEPGKSSPTEAEVRSQVMADSGIDTAAEPVQEPIAAEQQQSDLQAEAIAETESEPQPEPEPEPEPEPAPTPTEPASSLDSLVMTFSDACWVKVVDATGEEIAIGVKANGYRMPLQGQAPFAIILCKPDAVEMTYNGEPVDLSGYRRGRSVTMTLGGE
ncbi:RodZ domain-containing protein [Pseudidiomarina taiwanensis]|nr:RodZ domain-containing protein [Pseudidiomarina taiwanensis]